MPLLVLALLVPLALIVLIPLSLVQRIRRGTVRRQARGWAVTANLIAVSVSMVFFLAGALVTSTWAPHALTYTLAGLGVGALLGLVGFALTRWDTASGKLHYTPSRWLVLTVTLVVTARILYGFWRMWAAWDAGVEQLNVVMTSGLPVSMSAGAVVLGYYFVYWTAVRRRVRAPHAAGSSRV